MYKSYIIPGDKPTGNQDEDIELQEISNLIKTVVPEYRIKVNILNVEIENRLNQICDTI